MLSASTIGDVPTAQKPTAVLDAIAAIVEKGDAVESLARDAYEISFSSRRVGAEKVRGGYTPDATGERASCECDGEHPVTGEPIGGRDAETGQIIHVCSPHRYKRAGGNVSRRCALSPMPSMTCKQSCSGATPRRQTIGSDDYNPAGSRLHGLPL